MEKLLLSEKGLLEHICSFLDTRQDVCMNLSRTCTGFHFALEEICLRYDQNALAKFTASQLLAMDRFSTRIKSIRIMLNDKLTRCASPKRKPLITCETQGSQGRLVHMDREHDGLEEDNGNVLEMVCKQLGCLTARRCLEGLKLHHHAGALRDIGPIVQFDNLLDLEISWTDQLEDLRPLASFKKLKTLKLLGCNRLEAIGPIAQCSKLKMLSLHGCHSLESAMELRYCGELESITMAGCVRLRDIGFMVHLTKLHSLTIDGSTNLVSLAPLKRSPSQDTLETIGFRWCPSLVDVDTLGQCKNLRHLDLTGSSSIANVGCILHCPKIESLDLMGCVNVSNFSFLKSLQLSKLTMGGQRSTDESFMLKPGNALKHLVLDSIEWIENLNFLQDCATELEFLQITKCRNLKDISCVSSMKKLNQASFKRCTELRDVSAISHCAQLRTLDLSSCAKICDLCPLTTCHLLESLNLNGCTNLEELKPLHMLRELRTLDLGLCVKLSPSNIEELCGSLKTMEKLRISSGFKRKLRMPGSVRISL